MSPSLQYALTVGPLGFYFWVIAFWNSGRRPRVVNGMLDFTLLTLGVGGVVAFGPFGQMVAQRLFHPPNVLDWLTIVSALGLLATILARRSAYRVVVYHVRNEDLATALEHVLHDAGLPFVRTIHGYEDHSGRRGLQVDPTRLLGCVVIESLGPDSEGLIRLIRKGLRKRLRVVASSPGITAIGFYVASLTVMLAPMLTLFVTQPNAREALRVLLERIRGG